MKIGLLTRIKNNYKYICRLKTKCIFAIPKRNKNMRTIKFRGLRTDGKGWVYGNLIIYVNSEYHILESHTHINEFMHTIEVIPETVGQFTGLTDKNGVEIYEGVI